MVDQKYLEPMELTDLAPITVPVTIGKHSYVLKEASGLVARKYRSRIMNAAKGVQPGGKVTEMDVSKLEGLEVELVAGCLFEVTAEGKHVTMANRENLIRSWPDRVIDQLFQRAAAISGLRQDEAANTLEGLDVQIEEAKEQLDKLYAKRDQLLNGTTEEDLAKN